MYVMKRTHMYSIISVRELYETCNYSLDITAAVEFFISNTLYAHALQIVLAWSVALIVMTLHNLR